MEGGGENASLFDSLLDDDGDTQHYANMAPAPEAFGLGDAPTVVVTQPYYGQATLRQRPHAAAREPSGGVPRQEQRDGGATFLMATFERANERYEMFKLRGERVCGARLERCYRRLADLRRCFMCFGALAIVVAAAITSQSDQTAYVEDSMRPQYVDEQRK